MIYKGIDMDVRLFKKETEKIVELCREAMGDGYNVVITGHDMPDHDSVISAVMLRELLSRLGVEAVVKFGTCPDNVTLRDMRELGVLEGVTFDGFCKKDKLILVDHHVTFYKNSVIACVDHHITPPEPDFDLNFVVRASSCGRVIYDMACAVGVSDDWLEKMAIFSVYLDTQSCRSPKFDKADLPWLSEGIARLSIDENRLVKMGFCLNSPDEDGEILATYGYKRYEFGGRVGASTCIQIDSADKTWETVIPDILESLRRKMTRDGAELWAFVVNMPEISRSDIYFVDSNGISETVRLDRLASRSRDVIPVVKERFLQLIVEK